MMYRRHGSTEYDSGHYSEMRNSTATCPSFNAQYDLESDPESQQKCRYHTSGTKFIFGGTTICEETDNSAGIATTSTANNYCTGSAGTKHREMHSPIDKASSGEKCPPGSDGKHTYRGINTPHAQVTIRNEIQAQSCRSRHSLCNPEIHRCYGLVVGGAMMYKGGMTVQESKPTPTASNHRTGSAGRQHLGVHLPAANRSWILVNKRTLEEITTRVNKRMWRRVNQCNWR